MAQTPSGSYAQPVTGAIEIDDLTAPVLNADQRGALEYLESRPISLEPADLVVRAERLSGLTEPDVLGADEGFALRLSAQVAAIDADSGLTNLGRLIQRQRLVRLLTNRALLHDLLNRYPEIHDVDLPEPIVVIGLPRSGTTHLVNLLAADPARRSLPFWESQEPFARRGEGPGRDGVDPRYRRTAEAFAADEMFAPLTQAMHDRSPESIEEEVELLDMDLGSYNLEWHARVPSWRDFYLAQDHTTSYAYLRTTLQALSFLRGPRRWVLKSPQHLEQIRPLLATFPDARIVVTHRDPVAVIQSAVTMLAYGDRMRQRTIGPGRLVSYWIDRVERLLRAADRDRHLLPQGQYVDVLFHEFMADQLGTVNRCYEQTGLTLTDDARTELGLFLKENPRGKHGQVQYHLERDFGVPPEEVRERFAFYLERFPVRPEVHSPTKET